MTSSSSSTSYSYSYYDLSGDTREEEEERYAGNEVAVQYGSRCETFFNIMLNPWVIFVICALIAVGLLLLVILLPLSFHYVEYYNYALKHDTIHGAGGIDYSRVYTNGRYFWGLGKKQETVPRILMGVEYKQNNGQTILAFTDSGLEFVIECSFQFRIVKNEVPHLFQKFHRSYYPQIVSIGLRALKNVAPNYSLDDYISKREEIHLVMYNALVQELSSLCGEVPCIEIPGPNHFQLRRIIVPPQIHQTWLDSVVRIEQNTAQQNQRIVTLVRKETERLEAEITANVTLVNIDRDNEVAILTQSAEAQRFKIATEAKGTGIRTVIDDIGLTTEQEIQDLLDILLVLDSNDQELKTLYRRYNVFDDNGTTKVVFGASDSVVTV